MKLKISYLFDLDGVGKVWELVDWTDERFTLLLNGQPQVTLPTSATLNKHYTHPSLMTWYVLATHILEHGEK
jgi:hypothetical protein